jgi:hypothetical protein
VDTGTAIKYANTPTEQLIGSFIKMWQEFEVDDDDSNALVTAMISRLYGWRELGGSVNSFK